MDVTQTVLVAYASAHGSTQEIAEYITARLAGSGLRVQAHSVVDAPDPAAFDAVVIGSAIHDRAWLPGAEEYVRRFRAVLEQRTIWMFSVGMAPALRGVIGCRLAAAIPPRINAIREALRPRGYQQFAGVVQRQRMTVCSRLIYWAIGGGRYGDLRDWSAIARWADAIATDLRAPAASSGTRPNQRLNDRREGS